MSITAECYGNWLEIDMHTAHRQKERERERYGQTEHAFNLHYAKRLLVYHRNAVASYCPIFLGGNCPQTMREKKWERQHKGETQLHSMEPEQWQQQQQSLDNLKKFFLSFEKKRNFCPEQNSWQQLMEMSLKLTITHYAYAAWATGQRPRRLPWKWRCRAERN